MRRTLTFGSGFVEPLQPGTRLAIKTAIPFDCTNYLLLFNVCAVEEGGITDSIASFDVERLEAKTWLDLLNRFNFLIKASAFDADG